MYIGGNEHSKSKPSKQYMKSTFRDYCEESTLHGIKYFIAKDRPWIERGWWIFATVLSFAGGLYLINRVWIKWNTSPVIVSFAESTTSVWEIPFPAITICSETKSRQSLFNYTDYYYRNKSELTEEEIKHTEVVSLTCDQHIRTEGSMHVDATDIDFLEEVASPQEEVIWLCKVSQDTRACDFFTPIMTEEGLCFTSNALSHDDFFDGDGLNSKYLKDTPRADKWNLEYGYANKSDFEAYPRRTLGSGKRSGITILMRAYNKDLDYLCRGAVQGFKVTLHNPAETPRVSQRYFRVPLSQEVVLAVKPDMMTTNPALLSYSPERRLCYFPHERKLAYFKVYTQRNCELECLTNFTLKECGCVSYYMPRSNSTPICGSELKNCAGVINEKMVEEEIKSTLNYDGKKSQASCNCLISCTSIQYEAETSQADFQWDRLFTAYKTNMSDPELQDVNLARVTIYYKDNQFITSYRNELYGYADFLAGCGGLLGLCSGFSFLSVIEIIYYATIRLYNNKRREQDMLNTHEKKKLKASE